MQHPPPLHTQHSQLIGKVIDGRYEILQCIGEGGMGVVYKARQTSIDRMVAVKMLSSHLAKDQSWVQRFYNEAKACSRLHHPNTIRMFDFGQTSDQQLFMAMEFLDGKSLRDVISHESPIDPLRVLRVLIQCCASLSEAHNLGIIHRDIKADNVFLIDLPGSRDHVKLLDFGVAKLLMSEDFATQVGVVFGTPQYMSPEQGRGEPLSPRSDLYGVGILAYEMLTGAVPFSDPNPMNVIQLHLQAPIPPLPQRVPPAVQAVVMRALDKDPNRRFASANAMMEECQNVLTALTTGPFPSQSPHHQAVGTPGGVSQMGGPPPARPGFQYPASMPTVLDRPAFPGSPGFSPSSAAAAAQKTVMVNAHQQAVINGAYPQPSPPGGDGRTVMLPNSEGIVSLGSRPGTGPSASDSQPYRTSGAGASALFWIFCMLIGLAVGVGAYWLVLELGK